MSELKEPNYDFLTEKLELEEILNETKQRFNSLFHNNPDAVFTFDLNGKFTSANESMAKLSQIPINTLLLLSVYHFIIPEDRDIAKKYFENAIKGVVQNFDSRVVSAKGDKLIVNITTLPIILKGKIIEVYGIVKDITEQKRALRKIKQANERFERVGEATNDIIWDWDIGKNKLVRGHGFRELFGYELVEEFFSVTGPFPYVHQEDRTAFQNSLNIALNDKDALYWKSEYRYLKFDKSFIYVIDRGSIIRDENGRAVRMVGAMMDITQRKEYEVMLKKVNDDLFTLNKELATSNKDLEDFAKIASHDLQEPLRMISSYVSLIQEKYEKILDDKGKKYISFAVDGVKRMRQIILDLLEYSKAGRSDELLEDIDLNEMLSEITLLLANIIEEKKAVIVFENLPVIRNYKSPVRQVFQNLINNALKYQKENIRARIEITFTEKENEWEFRIKDNGIGISDKYFEKIFIIFQRLHHKTEYTGTGLGLALSKKIIENLGGNIWVESELDKGSTFYFTLAKN